MKQREAQTILDVWDKRGRSVYSKQDLGLLLDERGAKLKQSPKRLAESGLLIHASRDAYVYAYSRNRGAYTIESLTQSLRRRDYNYISYESALSEFGIISQVPLNRITVATTGRKGELSTPFGVIEFTHTGRNPAEFMQNTIDRLPHPLRIAKAGFALQNLRDSGRNLNLVDTEDREGDLSWTAV